MARPAGFTRTELEIARMRVAQLKTGLRSKVAKHQREIERQVEKIQVAEKTLEGLELEEAE